MTRLCLLVLLLSMSACGGLPAVPDTKDFDQAYDDAVEVCLAAHTINARTHSEPQLSALRSKIDEICEPALDALSLASSDRAQSILHTLRDAIDKVWK